MKLQCSASRGAIVAMKNGFHSAELLHRPQVLSLSQIVSWVLSKLSCSDNLIVLRAQFVLWLTA